MIISKPRKRHSDGLRFAGGSKAARDWDRIMYERDKRLIDEPCRGCGHMAGGPKDDIWRACEACSFNWSVLGVAPPLLPNGLSS